MTSQEGLHKRLGEVGIELSSARFEALYSYFSLLSKWNRRINLTGFSLDSDSAAAIDRLLLEPLAAAAIARSARRVLDVGSGGGSPAVPFFLGLEEAFELVMVESRARKTVFLREAMRESGIRGQVLEGRFERLETLDLFDAITVRAVAPDASLWNLVRRALAPGGRLFWFHSAVQAQPEQNVVHWDPPIRLLDSASCVSIGTAF